GVVPLAFQPLQHRARSPGRWRAALAAGAARRCRAAPRALLGARRRRRELHAGPARLRQSDRDRLLGGTRAVLALADVLDLLVDEFAGLRAWRLSRTLVGACFLECGLLRHCTAPFGGSG